MKKIEIFDPAMCCTTGVCGPSIDPELMRIATVISALKEKGLISSGQPVVIQGDSLQGELLADSIIFMRVE